MNKEYILKSWALIKDAMNPNNGFIIKLATDNLFNLIKNDRMNTLEDYMRFKDKWYNQMKNK